MNRRSFLQFLGLVSAAPVVLAEKPPAAVKFAAPVKLDGELYPNRMRAFYAACGEEVRSGDLLTTKDGLVYPSSDGRGPVLGHALGPSENGWVKIAIGGS